MLNFPAIINYPNGNKIDIDRHRLLLGLKNPYTLSEITTQLLSTTFRLENLSNPAEPINHTNNRFWLKKDDYNEQDIVTLKRKFGRDFDWVGPVYSQPNISGLRGLLCPLPNVLIVTLTSQASGNLPQISRDLDVNFTMKWSPEKSQYLGLNTHYYFIQDTQNFDAYQVKSLLEPQTNIYKSCRFEHMPLIVPVAMIPNDPFFNEQWNARQIRAAGEGTTAWDLSTGSKDVVICVIDSGCDLTHPDLKFANPGINLGTMAGDGSPVMPPNPTGIGHGTAVAGIIAATINNNPPLGVAGIAGNCRILPLAFVSWTDAELVNAIYFAASSRAKVINMSFQFNMSDTTALQAALQAASATALICAATGNQNMSLIDFPARSRFVMACGASDQNDNRQSPTSPISWDPRFPGSNFGAEMSVVAPGIRIPTTDIVGAGGFNTSGDLDGDGDLDLDFMLDFQGTSAAVPHLSGLAGLIFSVYPDISPAEARNIIEKTADKVGNLPYAVDPGHPNGKWNKEMGYGRINALRAVLAAAPLNPDLPWFREVVFEGTMILHDRETFADDEEKISIFADSGIPTTYQVGPFKTLVQFPEFPAWIDKVGGEVRGEVYFALNWKTDSSVDVSFSILLYEGTSEDTDDLDNIPVVKTVNIPRDMSGTINERVTNTDEGASDFIQIIMTITNNRRP